MGILYKQLLKWLSASLKNKKGKTSADLEMEKMISGSFDTSHEEQILPIIDAAQYFV